jgi:hypothetical protein
MSRQVRPVAILRPCTPSFLPYMVPVQADKPLDWATENCKLGVPRSDAYPTSDYLWRESGFRWRAADCSAFACSLLFEFRATECSAKAPVVQNGSPIAHMSNDSDIMAHQHKRHVMRLPQLI